MLVGSYPLRFIILQLSCHYVWWAWTSINLVGFLLTHMVLWNPIKFCLTLAIKLVNWLVVENSRQGLLGSNHKIGWHQNLEWKNKTGSLLSWVSRESGILVDTDIDFWMQTRIRLETDHDEGSNDTIQRATLMRAHQSSSQKNGEEMWSTSELDDKRSHNHKTVEKIGYP